jgi:RNA polymerase sigma-70 factor (ECF subfamily)
VSKALPDESQALALLERLRSGRDEAALAALYDLYSPKLYGLCLQILRDEARAQEVLQDVFLHLWERATAFDPARGRPFTWLVLLARSKSIDRLRSEQRKAARVSLSAEGDLEPYLKAGNASGTDALQSAEEAQRAQALGRLLDGLHPETAAILRLAYYRGLTQQEIARQLKLPLGTVKTRMRRGLAKLADSEARQWL